MGAALCEAKQILSLSCSTTLQSKYPCENLEDNLVMALFDGLKKGKKMSNICTAVQIKSIFGRMVLEIVVA